MGKNKEKKKKVKTVYIDDGSTIVDMSGVDEARHHAFGSRPKKDKDDKSNPQVYTGNKFKDSFRTYIRSVKLMILPMLVTILIVSAAFLIVWILLNLAS